MTLKVSRSIASMFLLLLVPVLVLAQSSHHDAQPVPVTGAAVPDAIAQRLVLLNLGIRNSDAATKKQLQRQQVFIQGIGLSAEGSEELRKIANQFVSTFHARVDQHNADMESGIEPDVSKLAEDRSVIVGSAMGEIGSAFSADDYARFTAYVKREKNNMKTTEVK